nr:ATP synthase subunit 9, mitochondrial [Ipomoea trifida]
MKKREDNSKLEMLEGAKSMGAGAATIASAGAAVGIGNVLSSSIHSVARNPSLAKQLFGYAILGFALTEAIASLLANKEAAKRSRSKKKENLKELETQVSEMKAENSYLWEHVTEISLKLNNALADKKILEADNETLRAKLSSMEASVFSPKPVVPLEGEAERTNQMDAKRERRLLANKEAAKRSRSKKKEHLKELETQVSEMKAENSYLWEHVTEISLKLNSALADKKILEADNETLRAKVTF